MAGKLQSYGYHADKGRGPCEKNFNKDKVQYFNYKNTVFTPYPMNYNAV